VEWAKSPEGSILYLSGSATARSGRAEELQMHSFLVAAIFIGMVLAPCVMAMFSGIE
jgi:hypothetical protein